MLKRVTERMEKMKDIKFRVWNKSAWRMEEVVSIIWKKGELFQIATQEQLEEHGQIMYYTSDFTKKLLEIMQYTGYQDEDSTEIYRGDIVDFIDYGVDGESKHNCNGEIILEDGAWHVTNSVSTSELSNYEDGAIKVVGNIFKNPELLEVS